VEQTAAEESVRSGASRKNRATEPYEHHELRRPNQPISTKEQFIASLRISDPDTLYVDCTAAAIQIPPAVFEGDTINLLMVRACQPLFSAALIGWVESHVGDASEKNALCVSVPSPDAPADWLRMWAATLRKFLLCYLPEKEGAIPASPSAATCLGAIEGALRP
jgi:hypothetical protein